MSHRETQRICRRASCATVLSSLLSIGLGACTANVVKGRGSSILTSQNKQLRARFSSHNFGAYCFDTLECRIEYGGRAWVDEDAQSSPLDSERQRKLTGSIVGIRNFPGPVSISWRSLDGNAHEAKIDVENIFEDERIVHSELLNIADVPKDAGFLDPDIIVVVENSTTKVYMKAFIPLSHPRKGLNAWSNHRDEAVLVWTQTHLERRE